MGWHAIMMASTSEELLRHRAHLRVLVKLDTGGNEIGLSDRGG